MPKLNQIVAVVAGKKTRTEKEFGDLNKTLQKTELFSGLVRRYEPLEQGGEQLPEETKLAVKSVRDISTSARKILTDIMDAVATQEWGNVSASADVKVNGSIVLPAVPITVLLYLEKQLNDLNTFVGNMPTLDPTERWTANTQTGDYTTPDVKTHRTKKIARPIVLYQATEQHPAQTQLIQEDILAGYWVTTKNSTAIPTTEKRDMLERIDKLIEAVRMAREEANSIDVEQKQIGDSVLNYIFGN